MDPQQALFIAIKLALEDKGYDVYDGGLPPENTPYPFIYMADSMMTDEPNKSCICGRIEQTIHVWNNNPKQRGTLSGMLSDIKNVCRALGAYDRFRFYVTNISQQIMNDDTTSTPLIHGILDIEFRFT